QVVLRPSIEPDGIVAGAGRSRALDQPNVRHAPPEKIDRRYHGVWNRSLSGSDRIGKICVYTRSRGRRLRCRVQGGVREWIFQDYPITLQVGGGLSPAHLEPRSEILQIEAF